MDLKSGVNKGSGWQRFAVCQAHVQCEVLNFFIAAKIAASIPSKIFLTSRHYYYFGVERRRNLRFGTKLFVSQGFILLPLPLSFSCGLAQRTWNGMCT